MSKKMTLTFSDDDEEQALYRALCDSSERAIRTPVTRQVKYILAMAMGLLDATDGFTKPPTYPRTREAHSHPILRLVPPVSANETQRHDHPPLGA